MTNNDFAAVTARTTNLSFAGFNVTLQEEEGANDGHATETVGYIAITQTGTLTSGSGKTFDGVSADQTFQAGTVSVDGTWDSITYESGRFSSTPLVFASMQTTNETDTAALRYQNASSTGVQLMTQEETSDDVETTHASETVGFLAIDSGEIWVDTDGNSQKDTIFQAEKEACKSVNQKLIEQGFGDIADVVIVAFDDSVRYVDLDPTGSYAYHTTPNTDIDDTPPNEYLDVEESLDGLVSRKGGTQFVSPLYYSYEALSDGDNPYVDPSDPNEDPIDDGLGSRGGQQNPIRSNGNGTKRNGTKRGQN